MDTFLTIVSKRDVRDFTGEEISDEALRAVVDAGRMSGSGYNKQPWRFVVVRERAHLEGVAACLTRPTNLAGASAAVALILTEDTALTRFDAGRCAQNMMLAAWNMKIGSIPNRVKDLDALRALMPIAPDEDVAVIVALGVAAGSIDPERRSADRWMDGADRRPFEGSVTYL